jgi:hypothetical protein
MKHGIFRNIISNLIVNKKIEKVFHSNLAFYKPVGYEINGKTMTDRGVGISTNSPLYKLIKNTVLDKNAIHNIRLKFECKGIWNIISFVIENKYDILVSNTVSTLSNNNDTSDSIIDLDLPDAINMQSKDIKFNALTIKDFKIDITVHKTDSVTIIIGCSYNPMSLDSREYNEFTNLLSVIEEKLARLVNDCFIYYIKIQKNRDQNKDKSNSNNNNNLFIQIPFYHNWIVTMWNFGRDSVQS